MKPEHTDLFKLFDMCNVTSEREEGKWAYVHIYLSFYSRSTSTHDAVNKNESTRMPVTKYSFVFRLFTIFERVKNTLLYTRYFFSYFRPYLPFVTYV